MSKILNKSKEVFIQNKFRIIILFLLILISQSCKRTEIQYYSNGKIKQEINFKGEKKNGICTWYYENGNKQFEFNYKNGMLEGVSKRWNYDGIIQFEDNYKDGFKHGTSKAFDEGGKLISLSNYIKDTLEGIYQEFYTSNQQIKIQGKYSHGAMDSLWAFFDEYGRQIGEGIFKNGNGSIKSFYSNGKIKQEQKYLNNIAVDRLIEYDTEGKTIQGEININ